MVLEHGIPVYDGSDTTGFQSPAQDHIEHGIDLGQTLDLRRPHIYPVRVAGQALHARGILENDILIIDTAAEPLAGAVAIAFAHGETLLASLARRRDQWWLVAGREGGQPLEVGEGVEIWGIVTALVRPKV